MFRHKLTMHTAYERPDVNKDPAPITTIACSKFVWLLSQYFKEIFLFSGEYFEIELYCEIGIFMKKSIL